MSALPPVDLAPARRADARELATMSRDLVESGLGWSWRPQRIANMIAAPEVTVLVARTRIEIAGFAVMEFHEEHAHLNLLAVKPNYRRSGLGRRLLEWLEASARVAGIARIQLEVRSKNQDARSFYVRQGFEPGQTLAGYYQGRESALRMVRHLIDPALSGQRP